MCVPNVEHCEHAANGHYIVDCVTLQTLDNAPDFSHGMLRNMAFKDDDFQISRPNWPQSSSSIEYVSRNLKGPSEQVLHRTCDLIRGSLPAPPLKASVWQAKLVSEVEVAP
jgi:hypothetical protein